MIRLTSLEAADKPQKQKHELDGPNLNSVTFWFFYAVTIAQNEQNMIISCGLCQTAGNVHILHCQTAGNGHILHCQIAGNSHILHCQTAGHVHILHCQTAGNVHILHCQTAQNGHILHCQTARNGHILYMVCNCNSIEEQKSYQNNLSTRF